MIAQQEIQRAVHALGHARAAQAVVLANRSPRLFVMVTHEDAIESSLRLLHPHAVAVVQVGGDIGAIGRVFDGGESVLCVVVQSVANAIHRAAFHVAHRVVTEENSADRRAGGGVIGMHREVRDDAHLVSITYIGDTVKAVLS